MLRALTPDTFTRGRRDQHSCEKVLSAMHCRMPAQVALPLHGHVLPWHTLSCMHLHWTWPRDMKVLAHDAAGQWRRQAPVDCCDMLQSQSAFSWAMASTCCPSAGPARFAPGLHQAVCRGHARCPAPGLRQSRCGDSVARVLGPHLRSGFRGRRRPDEVVEAVQTLCRLPH